MDRHESEVRHHQNKIDAQAEAHESEQERREAEAAKIDWKEVGEQAIRDMSEADKADQLRDWPDYRLADLFDLAVVHLTNWYPRINSINRGTNEHLVELGLKSIRDHQAELAKEHFMKTGELE